MVCKIKLTTEERSLLKALLSQINCTPDISEPATAMASNTLRVALHVKMWEFSAKFTKKGNLKVNRDSLGVIMSMVAKVSHSTTVHALWCKFLDHIPWEEYAVEFRECIKGRAQEKP